MIRILAIQLLLVISMVMECRALLLACKCNCNFQLNSVVCFLSSIGSFSFYRPRGGGLLGKVLLFSWNMTNQQNITGEQIGAYFGYSLCVVDVDGDKLDDLIVGAPMYTEPNNEGKYEMGRVYIIYQNKYVSLL